MKELEFENKSFKQKANTKPEPLSKGEPFEVRKGLLVRQRAECKLSREVWEAKMLDKYLNYSERVAKSLLTGQATRKLSVSSKVLLAVKDGI